MLASASALRPVSCETDSVHALIGTSEVAGVTDGGIPADDVTQ
jgi:hypothetical protein